MRGRSIAFVATCALAGQARAEPPGPSDDELGSSFLYDGGAIPFLWMPLAARLALDAYRTPEPVLRLRSLADEAPQPAWEVPGWAVTALAGVSALGMIGSGVDGRYDHAKGLAQALSTSALVTSLVDAALDAGEPRVDGRRRSPISGRSTQAFAIATYTILFLHGHVFDRVRGDGTLPWWEAATYGSIALGAAAVAGERVLHGRDSLREVGVGAALGTASSSLFYAYQSSRLSPERGGVGLAVRRAQGGGTGGTIGIKIAW